MLTTAPLALRPPGPCCLGCPLISGPTLRPHLAALSVAFLVFGAASSLGVGLGLFSPGVPQLCQLLRGHLYVCVPVQWVPIFPARGSSWLHLTLCPPLWVMLPLFCVYLLGQTDVPTELVSGPLSSPYTPNVNFLLVSNLISHGSLHPVVPKSQL